MANPTHIYVTAAEGREVPFPPSEVSAPNGVLLRALPGKAYRVPYTTYTRKRINSGDAIMCDIRGNPVRDLASAAAPREVNVDETGAATEVTTEGSVEPKFDLSDNTRGRKG